MSRVILLGLAMLPLAGCYYVQAVKGQWQLSRQREPITRVLQDEATSPALKARLRLVREARQFSIEALGLPDNDSYTTYADIERVYVVWNVFAAPEFSTRPKTWCFPVAGCVSYRGYFSREGADKKAARLAAKGYDVAVRGVAAYSTLGKFSDPIVSSMMNWDDTELVGVLFHELAHQVLYVKGDTAFNESFATAVEEFGVQRWLAAHEKNDEIETYLEHRRLREELMNLVATARADLEQIYGAQLAVAEKRRLKRARLQTLAEQVAARLERAGRDPAGWLNGALNNASLVPLVLYEERLPEFRALLDKCGQRIECFYAEAKALADR